jgi:hypothetical protein
MQQTALFHDSIYDALGADVAAAGGIKKVACALWPHLEPSIAAARLRSGLNPEHAQKLDPDEVVCIKQIAQQAGSSETVRYEDQKLGKVSTWVEPEDELERIERENNELLKQLLRRQERAESLRTKVRAVK